MKVGVLMGGISSEREISILTGKSVAAALRKEQYETDDIIVGKDFRDTLGELRKYDVLFNALHGVFGEDGQIQEILDEEGIPYTGCGARASRDLMDKVKTKTVFEENGITTPSWFVIKSRDEAASLPEGFDFPLVVKEPSGGSSVNVFIAESQEMYTGAVTSVLEVSRTVLVEQYIAGRELTVGILGDIVLPLVELKPKREFYDYEAKYFDDNTEYICPAPISEPRRDEIRRNAVRAFAAFGCRDMVRFDVIAAPEGNYFLEGNTIPGFTDHSLLPLAARVEGIPFSRVCEILIEMALERAGKLPVHK